MGPRINNKIFAKSVQVISSEGQNLGIMPTAQALQMATDDGLDLVEINANADAPIVKIMDYGKFKYEQKKRASEARKNQKTIDLLLESKGIRLDIYVKDENNTIYI